MAIEKMYTPEQVAELLQVCVSSVRKWYASGKLDALKVGRRIRIPESALEKFMQSRNGSGNSGSDTEQSVK